MNFVLAILVSVGLQLLSFYPFYKVYRQDRKRYHGNLSVSLKTRFAVWCIVCPVWAMPFAVMMGENGG